MDTDALRNAAHAILAALDAPDPTPDPEPVADIIEAEAEAAEDRIEAETEQMVEVIEAQAEAEVEVIEAQAEAEAAVIEAEAAAEVEVIEAQAEAEAEADDDDDGDTLDCPADLDLGDLGDTLGELVDDATEVLDAPLDDAPVIEPDTPPAPTHWYTRRRTFGRRK